MMFMMPLLLVPLISSVERANFKVTCEGNFAIDPPEGGGVQIGDMLLNTNGTIESKQMKRMEAALATLTSGYANLTSEVVTLKQDKAALTDKVADLEAAAAANDTKAALATLTSGYANLTSEVVMLKQDKAALVAQVDDLASSWYHGHTLEVHLFGGSEKGKNDVARAKLAGIRNIDFDTTLKVILHSNVDTEVFNGMLGNLETVGTFEVEPLNGGGFAAGDGNIEFKSLRGLYMFAHTIGTTSIGLRSLSFPALRRVSHKIVINGDPDLQSVSFPALTIMDGSDTSEGLQLSGLPSLAKVSLPVLKITPMLDLSNNRKLTGPGITINPAIMRVDHFALYNSLSGPITCSTTNGLTQAIAACKRFNTGDCGISHQAVNRVDISCR
eukprot:gene12017-33097_t